MSGYVIIFEITKMNQQYIKNSARKNNIEQTEAIPFIEWVSIYLHRYLKSIHKMPMKSFEFKSYKKKALYLVAGHTVCTKYWQTSLCLNYTSLTVWQNINNNL